MRTFELRQYTLRGKEALDIYMNQVYPRHLDSFPLFGIEPHGVWTAKDSVEPTAFVLVSYPEGEDPGEVVRRYMGVLSLPRKPRTGIDPTSLRFNPQFLRLRRVLL
jgi:hypothetical protein